MDFNSVDLQAFIHETNANSELQRYTSESSMTHLQFRHRVPYSSGWIASPATRNCLSWQCTKSCDVNCLSSLCWTIILAMWWSDSNKTKQNKDVPV